MNTRSINTRSMNTRSMTPKVVVAIEESPPVVETPVKKAKRVSNYEIHKARVEAQDVIRLKNRAIRVKELVDNGYITLIPNKAPKAVKHPSSLVSQIKIVNTDELTTMGLTERSRYPYDFPDAEELGFYGHHIVIDVFDLPYSCRSVRLNKVEYMEITKKEAELGRIIGDRIMNWAVAPKGYYWQYFGGGCSRFNDDSSYELFPLPIHYKHIHESSIHRTSTINILAYRIHF